MNLVELINSGKLSFEEFLQMHPFSESRRIIFDDALKSIDYFSVLYIKTLNTYYLLSRISKTFESADRNLVVVTGYRGCGKTNFLSYIKYIADGGKIDRTLKDTLDYQIQNTINEDQKKNYRTEFYEIKNKIYKTLQGAVIDISGKGLTDYIEFATKGQTTYINFDKGGYQKANALFIQLFEITKKKIILAKEKGSLTEIINIIDGFLERNEENIILNLNLEVSDLFDFREKLRMAIDSDSFLSNPHKTGEVFRLLKNLELEQFLFAFFLMELVWMVVTEENVKNKQLYFFDNIDMIVDEDGKIFKNTISSIFSYIYDSYNFFTSFERGKNEIDESLYKYYSQTNLIIAMRETSSMQVTGHPRKVVDKKMEPCDMSTDSGKMLIVKSRMIFGKKLINKGLIKNSYFIQKMENLENTLTDENLMIRLMKLNNNDVRTSDELLSKICEYNISAVESVTSTRDMRDYLFGIRGITYNNVFAVFKSEDYFKNLHIITNEEVQESDQYTLSYIRIILILLNKQTEKQPDRVRFTNAKYVELKALYNEAKIVVSPDEFASILDQMYSLREAKYWNHLITFDNVAKYTKEDIMKYVLEDDHDDDNDKIYIAITEAGKVFLEYVCIHFEYFSRRFSEKDRAALFDYNCFTDNKGREVVKAIISTVIKAVKSCCINLEEFNRRILRSLGKTHYSEIITSHYYYNGQFHEERIIHNHIQYLNAYRIFMLKKYGNSKEDYKYLIDQIDNYLAMLHTDGFLDLDYRHAFISERSKELYNKLSVCIDKIKESDFENTDIDITLAYYNKHYKNQKCKVFLERGL